MDSYSFYLNFLMVNQDQCSKGFFFSVEVCESNPIALATRGLFKVVFFFLLRLNPLHLVGPRSFVLNKKLHNVILVTLWDAKEVEHLGRPHNPILFGRRGSGEPIETTVRTHDIVLHGGGAIR